MVTNKTCCEKNEKPTNQSSFSPLGGQSRQKKNVGRVLEREKRSKEGEGGEVNVVCVTSKRRRKPEMGKKVETHNSLRRWEKSLQYKEIGRKLRTQGRKQLKSLTPGVPAEKS